MTSQVTATPPISSARASTRSVRRAAQKTLNPASARERAVAAPIPLLAPVTTAVRVVMPASSLNGSARLTAVSVRLVATAAALLGGVCWVAHYFVDQDGAALTPVRVLLAVATAAVGASLVRHPGIKVIAAVGAVLLAASVVELARGAADDLARGARRRGCRDPAGRPVPPAAARPRESLTGPPVLGMVVPTDLSRLAMVSLHTSPLDQPGTGDAGGMNVYVVELARRLAARGVEVDVFTRATSSALPPVVSLADGVHVRHIHAGPFEGLTKHELPAQLCVVRPRGAAGRGRAAGGPLRRRALPLLALRPGRRAGPRPVGRAAGAHHAHDGQGQERRAGRRRHPRARRPGDRRAAGGRRRRRADRQHRLRGRASSSTSTAPTRPGGGGAPRRRPRPVPARPTPPRCPPCAPGSVCRPTPSCSSSPAGSSR